MTHVLKNELEKEARVFACGKAEAGGTPALLTFALFRLNLLALVLALLPGALRSAAAEAHTHEAAPDQIVEIGALHGKMRFDKEQFTVSPGARVKLVFKNTDEMQHNLIICRPGRGVTFQIAQKAWALGTRAQEKQFVPDDPAVLFHTRVLNPQESETLVFNAPKEEGDYPYVCTLPGHAFTMKGVMQVAAASAEPKLKDVVYLYYEGNWRDRLPDFNALKPVKVKPLPANRFDLSVANRKEYFALQFLGEIEVPLAGEHTFWVTSDDGTKLFVNDELVVDNDGHHGLTEKEGKIQLRAGAHQVKLLYFQADGAKGLQVAWKGPKFKRTLLSPSLRSGPNVDREKFHLHVKDEPLVMRTFIDGGPARSVAVGLPGGVNYCFNAETCAVQFGWLGMFLDVGPDRGYGVDRGGGWSKILGERFEVGYAGCPLRFGVAEKEPQIRFLGYRRSAVPEFMFEVDGVKVTQTISAVPANATSQFGLKYDFAIANPTRDVFFKADHAKAHLTLTSSTGTWEGRTLRVAASEARRFSVVVVDQGKLQQAEAAQ